MISAKKSAEQNGYKRAGAEGGKAPREDIFRKQPAYKAEHRQKHCEEHKGIAHDEIAEDPRGKPQQAAPEIALEEPEGHRGERKKKRLDAEKLHVGENGALQKAEYEQEHGVKYYFFGYGFTCHFVLRPYSDIS